MEKIAIKGIEWQDLKKSLPLFQGLAIKELSKRMPVSRVAFGWREDNQVYLIKSIYRNGRLLSIWEDTGSRAECFYKRFFGKEIGK